MCSESNGCMLKPEYWIEKTGDADKLILNEAEIIAFNKKSFRKMKSNGFEEWLYDLETYSETILFVLLKEFIE